MIFNMLLCFCIYNANTCSATSFFIINNFIYDREWAQCHISGFLGGRKGRGITAEITTIRTTSNTQIAILAGTTALMGLCEVGTATNGKRTVFKLLFHSLFNVLLKAVKFHRRQKLAIREL